MAVIVAGLKAIEYRFLIKDIGTEIYIGIIALVFTGLGLWVGQQIINRKEQLTSSKKGRDEVIQSLDISEREMDVLVLMADGLSNQEIADKLFISIHTVKTHSSNLFSKLHAKRRTQAIQKAKEIGLIEV